MKHSMHHVVLLLNDACSKVPQTRDDNRACIGLRSSDNADGLVEEGKALARHTPYRFVDSTKYFHVTYHPCFFVQIFKLILEYQLRPFLVRHLNLEAVLPFLIVPIGHVNRNVSRRQSGLLGFEPNIATALELLAYSLQWIFPYVAMKDCMRAMQFLHNFDLCEKFNVCAELLEERYYPRGVTRSLVGVCESITLDWPRMMPRRHVQFHTALFINEGKELVSNCSADCEDFSLRFGDLHEIL